MPGAGTRQNKFLKIKKIAECQPLGTRQNLTAGGRRHGPATFCRVPRHSAKPGFAESQLALPSAWHSAKPPLPSALFCRVRHSAKYCFTECLDKKHSAKSQALGKVQFYSSVSPSLLLFLVPPLLLYFAYKLAAARAGTNSMRVPSYPLVWLSTLCLITCILRSMYLSFFFSPFAFPFPFPSIAFVFCI